jgi:hypothetical protein
LKFRNASDDIHPLHLHRHSFELVRVHGKPTAGVVKDVVMLGGFQEVEFDFVADNPGLTLFHCHQQLHMDYGFMALFNYYVGTRDHMHSPAEWPDEHLHAKFQIAGRRRCVERLLQRQFVTLINSRGAFSR